MYAEKLFPELFGLLSRAKLLFPHSCIVFQTVTYAAAAFLIAPMQISSSYVSRFGNRPYLIFTAVLAIIFGLLGIAATVMSWLWVGFGNFRLAYMSIVVVMSICLTFNVAFLWFWAIQAIRFNKLNPLPVPPSPPQGQGALAYFFPAASFRIMATIYAVLCIPMLGVTPFTNDVIAAVHVALAVATAILLICASFVAPRRWLILLSSICIVLLVPFDITAFSFSVIFGVVEPLGKYSLASFNTSAGVLQAVHSVVGFLWAVYGFRAFAMSTHGFAPAPRPGTETSFPRRRLIAFSSMALILSIGTITSTAFSCVVSVCCPDIHCQSLPPPKPPVVYFPA